MTPVALPELPEPYGWLHDARGNDPLTFVRVMPEFLKLCTSSMPVYSHAQIQAAVLAERAAERERCAAICEGLADRNEQATADQRSREAPDEKEQLARLRHWSTVSTYNAGMKNCAAAIRNQP